MPAVEPDPLSSVDGLGSLRAPTIFYRNISGEIMKLNRHLLLGSLLSVLPVIFARPAAAGSEAGITSTQAGQSISGAVLTLSKALALGLDLRGALPVDLKSEACGALAVTTASKCELKVDAACLAGCDPTNFTHSAWTECDSACSQPASEACKLGCNPTCKADCMASDCDFNAVTACQGGCQATCGAKCSQLAGADAIYCEIACNTVCSLECGAASAVAQIANCGVQCGASCAAECSAEINMDCQIACQSELFPIEEESCKQSCTDEGSLWCDGEPVELTGMNMEECINALTAAGIPVAEG
jgi:hypothetical protein